MHATLDVVPPCLLSKGEDDMSHPTLFDHVCFLIAMLSLRSYTSFDCVCCPRAMRVFHARGCLIVYVVQGRCYHATLDVVGSCMLSNNNDGMPHLMSLDRVCIRRAIIALPQPTSSERVCFIRAMMACHTLRRPNVYAVQRR